MAEMLSLDRKDREEPQNVVSRLTEEFLLDVRTEGIPMERAIRMPVANLSLLGEGVSSLSKLIEALPKNTESKETLYRVVNANKGDVLKVAKDGNFYGLIKPESGMSRFAKFEEVKAAANEICASNENDGVAKWMEEKLDLPYYK